MNNINEVIEKQSTTQQWMVEVFPGPSRMMLFTKMLAIYLDWARTVPEIMEAVEREFDNDERQETE